MEARPHFAEAGTLFWGLGFHLLRGVPFVLDVTEREEAGEKFAGGRRPRRPRRVKV